MPNAPDRNQSLRQHLFDFTGQIKTASDKAAICGDLAAWLAAGAYTPEDVEAALRSMTQSAADQDKVVNAWMTLLRGYKVIPEKPVVPKVAPSVATPMTAATFASRPTESSAVQSASEKMTPSHSHSRELVMQAAQGRLYEGNIVAELSHTVGSVLLSGRTGCGKSSTMRALMYGVWLKSFKEGRPARFKVIDAQDNSWLGLESADVEFVDNSRYPNYLPIVEYLNGKDGDPDDMIKAAARSLREASDEVDRRYAQCQKNRRSKLGRPVFEDYWLFFNEYLMAFQMKKDIGHGNLKQLGAHKWSTNISNIVFRGRDVGVHLCLSVQDHRKEACGISPNMARNMSLASTGLILPSGDGGYESLRYLANDSHILSEPTRRVLVPAVEEGIREGCPLILTTQGVARVGRLKDYTELEKPECEIARFYPYRPQAALGV